MNYFPLWDSLPAAIMWKQIFRDKDEELQLKSMEASQQSTLEGINYSIILNTAVMIEGYLDWTSRSLVNHLRKRCDTEECEAWLRIEEDFLNKINRATFSQYNHLFKLLTGDSLSHVIGSENPQLWEHISILFKFRNILSHGQQIELLIDYEKGTKTAAHVEFPGDPEKILDYFRKVNLHPKVIPESTSFIEMFLTNDIADHFFERAKEFIEILDKQLYEYGLDRNLRLPIIFKRIIRD